jgi:hypothetical protein
MIGGKCFSFKKETYEKNLYFEGLDSSFPPLSGPD